MSDIRFSQPVNYNGAVYSRPGGTFSQDTGVWTFGPGQEADPKGDLVVTTDYVDSVHVRCIFTDPGMMENASIMMQETPVVRLMYGSGSGYVTDRPVRQWVGNYDIFIKYPTPDGGTAPHAYTQQEGVSVWSHVDMVTGECYVDYVFNIDHGAPTPLYISVACRNRESNWQMIDKLEVVVYEAKKFLE